MRYLIPLLFLSSCMMGPHYNTPEICLPAEYEQAPCEKQDINLSVWWKQFEDPMLDQLMDEAIACNYDLRIALHKIEEVRGQYRIDRSILYPQIQGNMVAVRARRSANLSSDIIEATGTPEEIQATDFGGPLIQWFYQTGLDAVWEIDLWGKNLFKSKAAFYDLEATQENALDIQITLLSDVASSYIDIRSLQQRIKAKKQQICSQIELLELAQSRYEAGLTSFRDVTLAKSQLDAQEGTLPPLEEALQVSKNGLAILLGKAPEEFCIEEGYIPIAAGHIPSEMPSDLICRRPDIRQADRELAATVTRVGVSWRELLPTFNLTGSFGTQSNILDKLFVWPSRYWTIGPDMVWNLFTGGRLIAQIKIANERQKQALLNFEQTVKTALKEVEDRLVGYVQEQNRLTALEEQLAAASLTRDLSLEQYLAGLISLDDVLDAETSLYETQETMLNSQGTQMVQLVGLYKALGGGWECSKSL